MKRNKLRNSAIALGALVMMGGGVLIAQDDTEQVVKQNHMLTQKFNELANVPVVEASEYDSIKEGQWALEMVSRQDLYVTEEFVVTEIFDNGDIRGEKTIGGGEGVYLDKASLEAYELELGYDDIIHVSWFINDYYNEIWDEIQKVDLIAKPVFETK